MKHSSQWVVPALFALGAAACGTAVAQTQPPPAPAPQTAAISSAPKRHTPADVAFMRGMIAHHAQALEMTALVPTRTRRAEMQLLARRIDLSQRDEIAMLRRWLQDRGEAAPDPAAGHDMSAHGHDMAGMQHAMPGMASPEEMARLAAASGPDFDRLFLELMIRHHQGALTMVADLLSTPGAAQEPETFRFASDVDADQRAEIARMQQMLGASASPVSPR